jgi:hypothetical protein
MFTKGEHNTVFYWMHNVNLQIFFPSNTFHFFWYQQIEREKLNHEMGQRNTSKRYVSCDFYGTTQGILLKNI